MSIEDPKVGDLLRVRALGDEFDGCKVKVIGVLGPDLIEVVIISGARKGINLTWPILNFLDVSPLELLAREAE